MELNAKVSACVFKFEREGVKESVCVRERERERERERACQCVRACVRNLRM